MLEGKRISELETVTNLQTGCCFPVLSTGATKRITFGSLLSEIENNLPETGIEEVKKDVAELKVKSEQIDTLSADVENVKEEVADVDEMVQGQNATIRNYSEKVDTLEQIVEDTHFEDVLELEGQVRANTNKVNAIEPTIPAQASAQNQLADKNFVNSSIGTNTAHYISDNGEPFTSLEDLEAYEGTVTQNDYAFITGTDEGGNAYYDRYKADVNGDVVTWSKEYRLNNSSFTAAQWAAISSGITAELVANIPTSPVAQIDDTVTTTRNAWSASKTREEIDSISDYNFDDEVIVGYVIQNGVKKPRYRRVLEKTSGFSTGALIVILDSSLTKENVTVINAYGIMKSSQINVYIPAAYDDYYIGFIQTTNGFGYRQGNLTFTPTYAMAVVEYTKTTD